jgi:cobalamin synthase
MTTSMSRWFVPAVGFVLGLLIAAAEMGRNASPGQAALAFAIVAGYAIALRMLQSRSDMASLLSGMPRDERWASINLRALSLAAQLIAVVLVGAFLVTQFGGGDSTPYAWLGAVFALGYLGGLMWYRSRS